MERYRLSVLVKDIERGGDIDVVIAADAQRALDVEREKVKAEQEQWEIQAREGGRLKDQLTQLQAQLAGLKRNAGLDCGDQSCLYAVEHTGMRTNGGCRCDPKRMKDDLVRSRKACDALQAQLRQVEGQSKTQAEEAVIVFAKYTTLRQLVEALINSDTAKDHDKAWFALRATLAAKDAPQPAPNERVEYARLELAALFSTPGTPTLEQAKLVCENKNPADAQCILNAYEALREAAQDAPHPTEERS